MSLERNAVQLKALEARRARLEELVQNKDLIFDGVMTENDPLFAAAMVQLFIPSEWSTVWKKAENGNTYHWAFYKEVPQDRQSSWAAGSKRVAVMALNSSQHAQMLKAFEDMLTFHGIKAEDFKPAKATSSKDKDTLETITVWEDAITPIGIDGTIFKTRNPNAKENLVKLRGGKSENGGRLARTQNAEDIFILKGTKEKFESTYAIDFIYTTDDKAKDYDLELLKRPLVIDYDDAEEVSDVVKSKEVPASNNTSNSNDVKIAKLESLYLDAEIDGNTSRMAAIKAKIAELRAILA